MTRGRARKPERYLTEAELDEALDTAIADGEARLVQRLCFVKNCYAGDTATEAARRVGASRSTGSRWLDRWNAGGVEALRPDFGGGRPSKLAPDERKALRERLAAGEPWTTEAVREVIAEEFGVDYAPGYLPRLLGDLGLSYARADEIERPEDVPDVDGRTPLVGFFE